MPTNLTPLTLDEREACAALLQRIADDPRLIDDDERLKGLVARIHREGRRGSRLDKRDQVRQADRTVRGTAALARREQGVTPAIVSADGGEPDAARLRRPIPCYSCKGSYRDVHPFYHALCPTCAALNWAKRSQRADLSGRTALVTGARIKIGFEVALKLLRDGATVIATSRFPRDAARRFAAQPDAGEWRDRLQIAGLDLRFLGEVERFARNVAACDILIHNAAQTIRRPPAYYAPLIAAEREDLPRLASRWVASDIAPRLKEYALAAYSEHFPHGALDRDGEPLDARPINSWRLRVGEVETVEMAEAFVIGAMAPFVLTGALRPVMAASPHARRFVVSVSAMEGQFARASKTSFHPHTNMAKAALNMLTRTSAQDLAQSGIYLSSVDTGWVTDENPLPRREQTGFVPPLDPVDGAARVYDPIVQGVTREEVPPHGRFYKDYQPHDW